MQARLDIDPDAHVIVLGDLNDFQASKPVETLRLGPQPADGAAREPGHFLLWHAFDALPLQDRYTYIFNGASQTLDHLLLSPGLNARFRRMDIAHIKCDSHAQPGGAEAFPARVSLWFQRPRSPGVCMRPGGGAWIVAVADSEQAGKRLTARPVIARTESDALGEFRFFDLRPGAYSLHVALPEAVTLMAPGEDTDGNSEAVLRVEVERGGATVVELSARDRRVDAGAASALLGILYGSESAGQADNSNP